MRLRASLIATALALAGCEQAATGFDDPRADPGDAAIWAVLTFIKSRWTSREVREARAQMAASAASR